MKEKKKASEERKFIPGVGKEENHLSVFHLASTEALMNVETEMTFFYVSTCRKKTGYLL